MIKILTENIKRFNGTRNAISFYFKELDSNTFELQRTFYNYEQFNDFINDSYPEIKKLDMKTSCKKISKTQLQNSFKQFIHSNNISNVDSSFFNEIKTLMYLQYVSPEELNKTFVKFVFLIDENKIVKDFVLPKILELLKKIEYNNKIEDRIEIPSIENINNINHNLFELRIFNVGQANCSALIKYTDSKKEDYKVIFVFDFGFQKSWRGENKELNKMISKIDYETTILISHFDLDHINNIVKHTDLRTNRWVFPIYSGKREAASKIFQTLLKIATLKTYTGNVFYYNTPYNFSDNLCIYQYLNNVKGDKYQSTLVNSQCLVATLKFDNIKILIPADALYKEFHSNIINDKFNYVLIPHHCCEYQRINSLCPPYFCITNILTNDAIGIELYGNNKYGHPNKAHLSWYKNKITFSNNKPLSNQSNVISSDYYKIEF